MARLELDVEASLPQNIEQLTAGLIVALSVVAARQGSQAAHESRKGGDAFERQPSARAQSFLQSRSAYSR